MDAEASLLAVSSSPELAVVDYRGRPYSRSATGGWRSALFIIAVEIAERFSYYGISSNLITYLTGPLMQSNASAAAAVNAWSAWASMLPLLGAFAADSYLGRYRTIVIASVVYILALGLLTLTAMLPSINGHKCDASQDGCPSKQFQVIAFYASLYMVAFAQGGHKPCVQAFGADQFDQNIVEEVKAKSSFFNWWYFGMCAGTCFTVLLMNYIQDNIGWGLGFGIPCAVMVLALLLFLAGTTTYRYYTVQSQSPFVHIFKSLVRMIKRWYSSMIGSPAPNAINHYTNVSDGSYSSHEATEEEEAKGVLRLFPIWATCLIYGVVYSQTNTFFTKQGATLDRRIGLDFLVPPAALQSFISLSIVAFIPIYDCVLVPVARKLTGNPSGISMLQRIGTGMVLSMLSMLTAALVETKRHQVAREAGLVDSPDVPLPMSLWWLVPQYVLFGIADVFTMVGLQEFFYDQVPDALRSLGLALYLSIFGIGGFISSFLVSFIDAVTGAGGGESWFANNLNRGHVEYFYWLLAGLSAAELLLYLYFSGRYVYKKKACPPM